MPENSQTNLKLLTLTTSSHLEAFSLVSYLLSFSKDKDGKNHPNSNEDIEGSWFSERANTILLNTSSLRLKEES